MNNILNIIAYIAISTLLLVFILYATKFKNNTLPYKIFTIYAGLIAVCEWTCAYYLDVLQANNTFITHADTLLQFGLFSAIFYLLFKSKRQKIFALMSGSVIFSYFVLFYIINPKELMNENNLQKFVTSFILVLYCTMHLYNMLNDKRKQFYYITVGLLIYIVGSIIINLSSTIIVSLNNLELYSKIWVVNVLFYLVYQIFCIAEWKINYYKPTTIDEQ